MNTEALRQVADAIEASRRKSYHVADGVDINFDLSEWTQKVRRYNEEEDYESCQTVACVAGFTVAVLTPEKYTRMLNAGLFSYAASGGESIREAATDLLDLTDEEAFKLFTPKGVMYSFITESPRTPDLLRWMADNNTPDWIAAIEALGAHSMLSSYYDQPLCDGDD
jgi:predicted regulator of amino acid metabolism with ACT domain